MKRATINIEVSECDGGINYKINIEGPDYLLMLGLAHAIKRLESLQPEEMRGNFRVDILKLLNDRH